MKYWEIIADNLHKAGWSLGWVSAVDREGRTIWIVDAHGYGQRFIVRADEILTAFTELQRAVSGEFDRVKRHRSLTASLYVVRQSAPERIFSVTQMPVPNRLRDRDGFCPLRTLGRPDQANHSTKEL